MAFSSWWLDWLAACSGRRRDKWLCRFVELESPGVVGGDRVPRQELRHRLSDRLGTLDLQEMADPVDRAFLHHQLDEPADVNSFRREGDYWSIVFEERTVRVRDLKGMRYLARLLAHPGREFHVLDLVAAENGVAPVELGRTAGPSRSTLGDAGEMLDARAKDAYRRRLAEIEEDIEQARALGDAERAARADAEREFLVRELSRAVGLGGRDRRAASASERARVGVTRAVRKAIGQIGEHHPQLGEHLNRAIRTGTSCAYLPDPRASAGWRL